MLTTVGTPPSREARYLVKCRWCGTENIVLFRPKAEKKEPERRQDRWPLIDRAPELACATMLFGAILIVTAREATFSTETLAGLSPGFVAGSLSTFAAILLVRWLSR